MTEATTTNEEPSSTMSKEDTAFFVKTIWEALLIPSWTKDDLIELGKAVFAKVALAKLDNQRFERLLPFLVKISEILADRILAHFVEKSESEKTALKDKYETQITTLKEKHKQEIVALKASVEALRTSNPTATPLQEAKPEPTLTSLITGSQEDTGDKPSPEPDNG